jgi:hypothetical protein
MIGTIAKRRNHYELLGLAPSATDNEVGQAFTKAMFAPHRMAEAAQIGLAYEVLRDPVRRRAYDEEQGLARPARRPTNPSAISFRISAQAYGATIERPATTPAHSAPATPASPPQKAVAVERPVGSFIAQSLREPGRTEIPQPPTEAISNADPEPPIAVVVPPSPPAAPRERLPVIEAGDGGVSRVTLAAGGLVLAVVMLGAWAGVEAGDAAESGQATEAVTTELPKARPANTAVAAPTFPETARPALARSGARTLSLAALSTRRGRTDETPTSTPAAPELTAGQPIRHRYYETMAADGTTEIAVEELAKADGAAPVAAASLPLSNSTIARTIHRIGYGCGQVTSATAVEGASGVYKVSCSSGQTYRAAPVRGRYHFRRWSE